MNQRRQSNNFEKDLDFRVRMLDAALDSLIPAEEPEPGSLHSAMRYAVFPGGKRFRALLLLASYEAFGKNPEDAVHAACALELVHSYSLVHDDLPSMDDDDFRRGKPSVHKEFGEAAAILAGDALLTLAFTILSVPGKGPFPPGIRLRAVYELAVSSGVSGMLGGQAADMRRGDGFNAEDLEYIHLKKTAELIKCSAKSGAVLAGAGEEQIELLAEYGLNLGLAFQLLDDVDDRGKAPGEPNYADFFSPAKARNAAEIRLAKARSALSKVSGETSSLHGAADYLSENLGRSTG